MSAALKTMDGMELMDAAGEALTAREWAELLGLTVRGVQLAMEHVQAETRFVRGGLARVYRFADLPPFYRTKLETLRGKHVASSYSSLLSMRHVETRWVPQREWMTYPEATRERALRKKTVAQVYFAALDNGREKREANVLAQAEWLKQFGEPTRRRGPNEKSIRRLEAMVEARGGIDFAPNEAYCDGKSTPHVMARRVHKLGIPLELIAEFADRTTKTEHISGAFRSLEYDWQAGREVPGLGQRSGSAPFPYKLSQLREFAASTPTRRLGSHGKARARREALPSMRTSTANLRRAELYMLDDSRLDIIATDDLTGRPVECRLYWMIDVGPRRIEGFVLRQMGHIKANDVDTLVTRVLRSSGLAAVGAGYKTRIKFEKGTVSCSPSRKSLLLGAYPAQLEIDSTSMDGGKNHPGAAVQSGSGHWMGKAHIESFMRTVSFFLEHLPGQRGGTFRKQPAQLGLQGKDRESGYLHYHLGSSMHEAALLEYGNRALEWIHTGEVSGEGTSLLRLKVSALRPVSWIQNALQEFIHYFNHRTDHRMEGFARIEYQEAETGALRHRMESPHERAAALDRLAPTVRLPASDAAMLLTHDAKPKTVRAGGSSPGLTMDIEPWKGLRFWTEGSIACHEAARLATLEKQFVVVYDREAIRLWTPGSDYTPEVHLLTEAPGKPGSRWLETLPLASYGDRTDAESMARELEKVKKVEQRHTAELVRASAPAIARRTAEARENLSTLRGTITVLDQLRETAEPSALITDIRTGRPVEASEPTRAGQMDGAAAELARFQAEHLPRAVAPVSEQEEPEIF